MRPLEKARGSNRDLNCEKAGEELWIGVGGAVEKLVADDKWDGSEGAVEKLVEEDLREEEEAAELWSEL